MRILHTVMSLSVASALSTPLLAQDETVSLRVAGWNMQSHGSDDSVLQSQLAAKDGVDLWGLSEVRDANALGAFEQGAEDGEGADFDAVLGTTGGGDRLAILFDRTILELLDTEELTTLQEGNPNHRAALVAHFRGVRTGQEFKFLVNHLARRDSALRARQAAFLNDWARMQTLPLVAVGDYNLDYHVSFGDGGDRDPGFDAMTNGGTWIWVRPETLVKTQASDRFNTVLDFVFVGNAPSAWTGESAILLRAGDAPAPPGDFDDDGDQTDHRPVDAVFVMTLPRDHDLETAGSEVPDGPVILQRLDEIEVELGRIRALLR